MRIIPAIDIIDGKCVRLTQGDYAQKKIYNENPAEVAKSFEDSGLKYLHVVDLDGAKAGRVINWKALENITRQTNLAVDFGGGIKTEDDIKKLLETGVRQVNLGSVAVKNPAKVYEWIGKFGADKIMLSADVKKEIIAISGWQENSELHIYDLIANYIKQGIQYVVCTDIHTDGMLTGPNTDLYKKINDQFPELKLVASGGVSTLDDVKKLNKLQVDGVIIGKAIYEGKIKLEDLTIF